LPLPWGQEKCQNALRVKYWEITADNLSKAESILIDTSRKK